MKKILLFIAILFGLSSVPSLAQGPNMSRYITITVVDGQDIRMNLRAASNNTPIRIVSGANTQNIIVDNTWYADNNPDFTVTADGSSMTIYGDITEFSCAYNQANITGLDISNNTQLKYLNCFNNRIAFLDVSNNTQLTHLDCESNLLKSLDLSNNLQLVSLLCFNNRFNTDALNMLYCSLPVRPSNAPGVCYSFNTTNDENYDTLIIATSNNARNKNWAVKYYNNGDEPQNDVPSTGRFSCEITPNMSKVITLNVVSGQPIKLDFKAATENTPVRIVSGNQVRNILVGTNWFDGSDPKNYYVTSGANTMTIYGEINHLDFSNNGENVTGINTSSNQEIKEIYGANNKISNINLTGCNQLSLLNLENNNIDNIDLSTNAQLSYFNISNNKLTYLNVANNAQLNFLNCKSNLIEVLNANAPSLRYVNCANNKIRQLVFADTTNIATLNCANNNLYTLGISTLTKLTDLDCSNNKLTNIDLSGNIILNKLNCNTNTINLLDLSTNSQISELIAFANALTVINVSNLAQLRVLEINNNQIPSLDISNNPNIEVIKYYGNTFNTESINLIYCSLPNRENDFAGQLAVALATDDEQIATVLASNASIARDKNWEVKYKNDAQEIVDVPTTGSFICGDPVFDESKFITLTVVNKKNIRLSFKANRPATPIRVVSGNNTKNIIVGTNWTPDNFTVASEGTTMTVYGNISGLKANSNNNNLTAVDFTNAPALTQLELSGNSLSEINVANLTELQELNISNNLISILDISTNTKLTKLLASKNHLKVLNLRDNPELTEVRCDENRLSALDLTANTKLNRLFCYKNPFTTGAINELYCSLPQVTGPRGTCYPLFNQNDELHNQIAAATSDNARKKNWQVSYNYGNGVIQNEGSFACYTPNMNRFITLKVSKFSKIKMNFKADAENTDIRIISGDKSQDYRIGTNWFNTNATSSFSFASGDSLITIYGNVSGFNCSNNISAIKNVDVSNNPGISVLQVENNQLTSLDLRYNTKLTALHATKNILSKLDISNNTLLAELFCDLNLLNNLDVSKHTQLVELRCNNNNLTELDLTKNSALEKINCSNNQIPSIDVNNAPYLKELVCNNNRITTLGVSNNYQLAKFVCNDNMLSALDLSTNSQLKELVCYNNLFSTQVVNEIYCSLPTRSAEDKGNVYTLNTASSSNNAKIVAATAANARAKNWNVMYYNNGNNQSDIPSKGSYSCSTPTPNTGKFIKLAVSNKKEINLNFKAATNNTPVRIVTGNTTQELTIGTDWYSHNFKVTSDGKIIVIYGDIVEFSCANNNNSLKNVDISNNTALEFINCSNNFLSSLDISKNPKLQTVYCNSNQLTELELSNNSQLSKLTCYDNPFTTEAINDIYCSLPIGRSDSTSVIYTLSDITDYNHSIVVEATSQNARDKNWKVKYLNSDNDIPSNGTYKCPKVPTPNMHRYVRLSVARNKDINLKLKAATGNTPVRVTSGANVQNIIVGTDWYNGGMQSGFTFTSADTAIVIYGDVVALDCSNNKKDLSFVDLTNNTQLKELICSGNHLTTIDVRRNSKLTNLDCSNNMLETVDVSNNELLKELNASYNILTSIDLSKNYLLKDLNLSRTELISINVTNNTLLEKLNLDSNNLAEINIRYNNQLEELTIANNKISILDLSNNRQLKRLYCGANLISSVDFSNNTILEELDFSKNLVNYVELDKNIQLAKLNTSNNSLTVLDVLNNAKLNDLNCSNNQLLALSIKTNLLLENLNCANNSINYLDLTNNAQLLSLECQANNLTNLDLSNNIRLKFVNCHSNLFTTEAVNNIYCSLPTANGTNGLCYTLHSNNDANYEQVSQATSKNARDKNWEVKFASNSSDITSKGSYACEIATVDMSKVVTLTVASGKNISLNFKANKNNTRVRIVSGSNAQDIVVGTEWYDSSTPSKFVVTPDVTTISIYGNISALNCSKNETNITEINTSGNSNLEYLYCSNNGISSLDLSKNAKLVEVHCYKNPFTTLAINELYCSLVANQDVTKKIYPLNTNDDPNHAAVVAATSKNARDKNWEVKYLENKEDIESNGKYDCFGENPNPNMYSYITLTVKDTATIKLSFKAFNDNTDIRIISGSNIQDVKASKASISSVTVKADGTTMTVYGDIVDFSCIDNDTNVTAVDASNNTQLKLFNVRSCQISSLDLTKNNNLIELVCNYNKLTSLDVTKNDKLEILHCDNNELTNLDVSANRNLKNLSCSNNKFSTNAVNFIYCALPESETGDAECSTLRSKDDENHETIVAATSDNARQKRWKVIYADSNEDIPNNGNFDCSTGVNEEFSGISIFPNPARSNVMIQLDANVNETLILVDLTGRALLTADVVAGKANIDVSDLTSGTYFIKVGNRVQKLTVK